jgi:hypothetical protein
MSKPTTEIMMKQMVDFLEKDIELDQNLIKNIPDGKTKKLWEEGIVIKKAILAALSGPSEEEGKKMLEFYRSLKFNAKGPAYVDEEQKIDSKIEALIRGGFAPGKEPPK